MLGEIFHIEKMMGACEKIIYFLLVNLFFWGSNLPLLLFFVFVGISQAETFLPLFLLCAIPAGPALCGVFFSMNRMLKGTEVSAWKDYWAGYKDGFLKKLGVAAIQAWMVGMFWTNIRFFTVQCPVFLLALLFILLFAVSLLMTPDLYLLASRYDMSIRDIWKGALVLCIGQPLLTFGNTAALAFVLMLLEVQAGICVLFVVSLYGFVVVFINQKIFRMLEAGTWRRKDQNNCI
ncbi:DUF624 domain-containing protein [Schaedlerella arabinosiphila]|uniref:DUF624 domain-containing protein n=1 Tax=Schaedlerella arabinosiphila TaxID=2044587 RepID=A0A426DD17_9FIRM|nr:DUF624 domain-containing protein [Schaedlerella arabinosiphila]RRK30618.1 DUF624 domain-containing protein [Schaedlerella arabinosiphila]